MGVLYFLFRAVGGLGLSGMGTVSIALMAFFFFISLILTGSIVLF